MKVPDSELAFPEHSNLLSRSFIVNKTELQGMWNYNSQEAGAEAYRREVIGQVFDSGKPHIFEGKIGDVPNGLAVFPVWNENGELDSVAVFEAIAKAPDGSLTKTSGSTVLPEQRPLAKLFSVIAHDLRSPFANIIGLSELLKEEACKMKTNEIQRFASTINSTASKSLQLLDNLLEWARIQQGKAEPDKNQLPVYEIAEDIFDFFIADAENKNLRLINGVHQNATVFGDENMVRAILRNLISNAIKFSEMGGEIEISVAFKSGFSIISVRDSGVGIKPEQLKTLFCGEANKTTSGTLNERGTGLGLMLCRDYTELHGGKIWAESKVGEGSVFSFSLPDKERSELSL